MGQWKYRSNIPDLSARWICQLHASAALPRVPMVKWDFKRKKLYWFITFFALNEYNAMKDSH
jgi:hypothetical protein